MTMAAYFAGVVQAPATALVIVTEMTGDHDLTLPLMAVNVASARFQRNHLPPEPVSLARRAVHQVRAVGA